VSAEHRRSRRHIVKAAAGSVLGLAAGLGSRGVLAQSRSRSQVFVLLRGGADGLSLIVPHADPAYYRARPRTAIAPPGSAAACALDLDGQLGMHPQLASLSPLYRQGELGIVVAAGLSAAPRLHRDAQRALEQSLAELAGEPLETQAPSAPLSLQFELVARAIRAEWACSPFLVSSEGWDTHAAQGTASRGYLAARLDELSRALLEFRGQLAAKFEQTQIVVLSEFGRSVDETPMGGTDDGRASVALVLGNTPFAGRISGRWPSLEREALVAGRHLPIATDLTQLVRELSTTGGPS